ncbi:hemolysin family protein [Companilactobacillus mishanensis]|uniref:HlyC/CorC family transporter n=1 Tax=Companilactobacillus mishanensis TaxID=2486008 RepID=A0A5P0ZHL4_9LACO|nr:hemolysin family protein [Companilactobacillus mishanensis]MQS45750.1 HlyC/CorC family transporter [Companilactobacillus mishanensis]MQS52519.1 HlyC/CorC family transporter [Companilactobacillus mishanensis]MQS89177.1 HlyC/CorC family transporter [Companilactobacillus mishanensis]
MSSSTILSNFVIILITFIFAFFCVAAEFALVQTRSSQLEDAIEKGEGNIKKLKRALKMVNNLNEYLSTTQVGTSIAGIVLGWIGEGTIEYLLVDFFGIIHLSNGGNGLHILGSVIGVLLLTYFEVVLTEIVPKNISIDMPLQMLMLVVTPLRAFHIAVYPFVWLLNVSSSGIIRLVGLKPADSENEVFSQSEILNLSKSSVNGGDMDQNDVLFMQRAFELNDKVAKDIMVDRTSLYVVDITDKVNDVIKDYLQQGFSRFPVVADNDKDKILGYVYAYDIVRQNQVDGDIGISRILRSVNTVPETMPIQDILSKMIKKQTPIVIVVDEYGGTSGIVTDKDIYEELFGTVKDEIDVVSDEYIIKNEDKSYNVSGKTTLYDFERYFKTDIKAFQESDIITIGGYILEKFPNIKQDSEFDLDNFHFRVAEFDHGFANWFKVTVDNEEVARQDNLASLTTIDDLKDDDSDK